MKTFKMICAASALAVAGAAHAGKVNPPVVTDGSASAGNGSLSIAVNSYAAPAGTFASVASLPGAFPVTYEGQQAYAFDFVEGGVEYRAIVTSDDDVYVRKI